MFIYFLIVELFAKLWFFFFSILSYSSCSRNHWLQLYFPLKCLQKWDYNDLLDNTSDAVKPLDSGLFIVISFWGKEKGDDQLWDYPAWTWRTMLHLFLGSVANLLKWTKMTLLWVFFCFCCLPHNFALQLFFESIFSFPKTSIADCDRWVLCI